MKRENFYSIVIILLLLLNIGTLGYLWMDRGNGGFAEPPRSPDHIIINELKLDEEQQELFHTFKRRHRGSTDSVQHSIRKLQKELFGLVEQDEMNVPLRDSLLHEIEKCESAKHLITIEHFHEIRSILRPEQKELFNEFMDEIGSRITGPGRPPHHGPPPPRH